VGTQEAYTICKEVDPKMERSIGVITKIDTIEEADRDKIIDKISGIGRNSWKFNMGCVAVRNRNQAEIQSNASRDEVDRKESDFFRTHKHLRSVPAIKASEMLGFTALMPTLIHIQAGLIAQSFPKLSKLIQAALS
jgi:Dynamin central region